MRDLHSIEDDLHELTSGAAGRAPVSRVDGLLDELSCSLAVLHSHGLQLWPD